ncbi:hypothetical protein MKW98_024678 [Papaver atlanticum]|uniref:Maturase n=1 Tax=Papaver atlanticum TaxID=357466 RepID=A0AAD4X6E7_9MAGN|nr:hypothetical protein MKW98_024678 [Papaver atlanticum]
MVPESIYDSEFPDTSHFRSGRDYHSALKRIKKEWGTSRWFLEFDIRKHIIDQHRLIPILKEEIDDPNRTLKMNGPDFVPHSVLLLDLPGNIYLYKLDQEIGRIRHKYEIPMRIRSVLSQFSGRIDDQAVEEAIFNTPQDNGAIFLGKVKSIQRKAAFHSLVSSKKTPSGRVPYGLSLFLCAAVPKAEFYGRERKNSAMRKRKISRRGLLIELGGELRPVIRSEKQIQKCLTHFLQSGLNLWSAGSITIAARSTVEFPGTVIREVPYSKQEKHLWVKNYIHITACHLRSAIHSQFRNLGKSLPIKELTRGMSGRRSLLDAVQLAETLGTAGVRSPQLGSEQGAIGRSLTIGHECNDP